MPPPDPIPAAAGRRRRLPAALLVVTGLALALLCMAAVMGAGLLVARNRTAVTMIATEQPAQRSQEAVTPPGGAAGNPAGIASAGINRIAFVDPGGQLGTVAPDGRNLRLVSAEGGVYQFPAWSPDGLRIAAVGNYGEQGVLAILPDREAGQAVDVYRSASRTPFYLYWSPDGQQVSFLANDPSGIALHLAPADGSAESRVLATGQPFYWDWADSADQLLIHTGGAGEDARLAVIDTEGSAVVDGLARPGLFQAPGISASGRYIAFAEAGDELMVVVVDEERGERTEVPHRGVVAMSWSPTRDQLAFTGPESAQASFIGPLRWLDPVTGEVRTLVRDPVITFFWSPDGSSIAYLTHDAGSGAPQAGRPPGLARSVPAPSQFQVQGRLVLKLWVVDVDSGDRRLLASFEPTPVFVSQFIPYFDQYALSHRLWSPSSDALVLPMLERNGRQGIYVISVDGARRRVADGSMAFWSPR